MEKPGTINSAPLPRMRTAQIQSLDRGLQLLEYISQAGRPLSLVDLEGVLEVDRSTVHRLLSTLVERGYVAQDPDSKRYSLGLKVVQLSRYAIDSIPLRKIAKAYMEELKLASGESVNLAVIANDQVVCVDHEPSDSALAVTNDIGAIFVPHATSAGKTLLAFQPEEQRMAMLGPGELKAFTPRTIIDINTLTLHLQQVRQQGYAVDDEERYLGVRCIAAPIFDHRGKVIASISVSGPNIRLTYERLPGIIRLAKECADAISAALGSPRH